MASCPGINGVMNQDVKKNPSNAYITGLGLLLKSRLNIHNLITAINTWVVEIVRFSGVLIDWTGIELDEMDRKARHLLVENRFLHSKGNTIRLNRSCKDGRCGLIGIEECVANVFSSRY